MSSAQRRPDRQQGVFETLLVLDGEPVEVEAHLTRLGASLEALFPGRPPPRLAGEVEAAAAGIARGGLRVTVVPDIDEAFEVSIEPATLGSDAILPSIPPAVDACTLVVPGGLGAHKWADRTLLDEAQARLPANALPLIVDWDGAPLEASRANLFAVLGETLLTPPLDGRILPGVARARVLALAGEEGLAVREASLSRADLTRADEAFLTGSLRGVERLVRVDGTPLRGRGEVAAQVQSALRRAWLGAGLDRVPRR